MPLTLTRDWLRLNPRDWMRSATDGDAARQISASDRWAVTSGGGPDVCSGVERGEVDGCGGSGR